MPRAILTLAVPEELWIGQLSREHPDVQLRVLSAIPSGPRGVSVAELTANDPASLIEEIRAVDSVIDIEPLDRADGRALLQFETRQPILLDVARESGVPIRMPFTIRDGEIRWEVTTSRERLAELGDQLEAFGIAFTVESIYQRVDAEQFLTDNQWAVLRRALELGYYDTPRECTQYELAEDLEIARSTCSEILHRAEERIVKEFVATTEEPAEPTVAH